jgi:hypothetical protein
MNYGMTYKINEKVRNTILESLPEEKFLDIGLLGDKILEINDAETGEINGKLYEVF